MSNEALPRPIRRTRSSTSLVGPKAAVQVRTPSRPPDALGQHPELLRHARLLEIVAALQRALTRDGSLLESLDGGIEALLAWSESTFGFVAEYAPAHPGGLTVLAESAVSTGGAVALAGRLDSLESPWRALVRSRVPVALTGAAAAAAVGDLPLVVHSFVSIPLLGDGGAIGVLALFNRRGGYSPSDVTLLEHAASALAMLVEFRRAGERERRLETEVQRWENLYATVIESTGVCLLTTDADGTIRYANPTAVQLLGAAGAETLGSTNLATFHDPAELARAVAEVSGLGATVASPFGAIVARAAASGGVDRRDWTWISLGGERVPMVVTLSALREPMAGVTGWVVVGTELTEHYALEQQKVRAAQLEAQLAVMLRHESDSAQLATACQYVAASRTAREALTVMATFVASAGQGAELLIRRDAPGAASGPTGEPPERCIERHQCWALRMGQGFVSERSGLRCAHLCDDGRAWFCAPIDDGTQLLGVVAAPLAGGPRDGGDEPAEARSYVRASLLEIATKFSGVMANLRLRLTLEEQATRDPLTGAMNRRRLDAELAAIEAWHRATGEPFAVLTLDMDHFKAINDAFGHERGDRVLVGVVETLQRRFREGDAVARVGGEEFVVVLRGVSLEAAGHLGELARCAIAEAQLAGAGVPCTCSVGVVHVERLTAPVRDLLGEADRALYRAKRSGRNCVVCVHAAEAS